MTQKEINKKDQELQKASPALKRVRRSTQPVAEAKIAVNNIYSELKTRIVDQKIIETLNNIPDVDAFFDKQTWINGIKEFIWTGLYQIKDYVWGQDTTIAKFNPVRMKVGNRIFQTDITKRISYRVDLKEAYTAFTTPARTVEFVNKIIEKAVISIQDYLFEQKIKWLLNLKNDCKKDDNSNRYIDYDKEITIKKASDFSGDEEKEVLDNLDEIRNAITRLQSPVFGNSSNSHLKLTGFTSGEKAIIKYSTKPSNLRMLVNLDFYNKAIRISRKLFDNKNLFMGVKFKVMDFSLYASGPTSDNVSVADLNKIKFILFHKDSNIHGVFVENITNSINSLDFKIINETAFEFTFVKNPFAPSYLYKST